MRSGSCRCTRWEDGLLAQMEEHRNRGTWEKNLKTKEFYRHLQGQDGNVTPILAAHAVSSLPSSTFGSLLPKVT